jgi:hypothetical protein
MIPALAYATALPDSRFIQPLQSQRTDQEMFAKDLAEPKRLTTAPDAASVRACRHSCRDPRNG